MDESQLTEGPTTDSEGNNRPADNECEVKDEDEAEYESELEEEEDVTENEFDDPQQSYGNDFEEEILEESPEFVNNFESEGFEGGYEEEDYEEEDYEEEGYEEKDYEEEGYEEKDYEEEDYEEEDYKEEDYKEEDYKEEDYKEEEEGAGEIEEFGDNAVEEEMQENGYDAEMAYEEHYDYDDPYGFDGDDESQDGYETEVETDSQNYPTQESGSEEDDEEEEDEIDEEDVSSESCEDIFGGDDIDYNIEDGETTSEDSEAEESNVDMNYFSDDSIDTEVSNSKLEIHPDDFAENSVTRETNDTGDKELKPQEDLVDGFFDGSDFDWDGDEDEEDEFDIPNEELERAIFIQNAQEAVEQSKEKSGAEDSGAEEDGETGSEDSEGMTEDDEESEETESDEQIQPEEVLELNPDNENIAQGDEENGDAEADSDANQALISEDLPENNMHYFVDAEDEEDLFGLYLDDRPLSPESELYRSKMVFLQEKYETVQLYTLQLKNRLYSIKKEVSHFKRLKRVLVNRLSFYGDRLSNISLEIPPEADDSVLKPSSNEQQNSPLMEEPEEVERRSESPEIDLNFQDEEFTEPYYEKETPAVTGKQMDNVEKKALELSMQDWDGSHGFVVEKVLDVCQRNATEVFLARRTGSNDQWFALKVYNIDQNLEALEKEVKMLRHVRHRNIVELLDTTIYDNEIALSMKCALLGTLRDIQAENFPLGISEKLAGGILCQLLDALIYLQEQNVVHRSVQPKHVLMERGGRVRLSGLRHAIALQPNTRATDFDDHLVESIYYLAPEVLAQDIRGYSTQSDVYSLGMTLCDVSNGISPFSEMIPLQMLRNKISPEELEMIPQQHRERLFNPQLHEIVAACFTYQPEYRPTPRKLRSNTWLMSFRDPEGTVARELTDVDELPTRTPLREAVAQKPQSGTSENSWSW
ncbi:unnamed protein product [Caenorhabditis auriculariae]|uniref:non-specific serine/threonine protein kinase n=1 Tax=Caenorhabditis auriculariae TaxID=2777116 RepID=A0A8S1GZV3_9PELO|nr:unnamed protein product [Caenorhabditis auriculariae]